MSTTRRVFIKEPQFVILRYVPLKISKSLQQPGKIRKQLDVLHQQTKTKQHGSKEIMGTV